MIEKKIMQNFVYIFFGIESLSMWDRKALICIKLLREKKRYWFFSVFWVCLQLSCLDFLLLQTKYEEIILFIGSHGSENHHKEKNTKEWKKSYQIRWMKTIQGKSFEITSIINPREVFTIVNHLWRDFKDTKQENNRTCDNTRTDVEDV